MRPGRRPVLVVGAALAAAALAMAPAEQAAAKKKKKSYAADKGPAKVDVTKFPAKIQDAYKVFAVRCSKCHTLARPINTDMTIQKWKLYIKRMMNKPDSGISPKSGKKIYRFLKFYQRYKNARRK